MRRHIVWQSTKTRHRKKLFAALCIVFAILLTTIVRLTWVMIVRCDYYLEQAEKLHERERKIKAMRGTIYDTNGVELATNTTVCTISVIHSQVENEQQVADMLSQKLQMEESEVIKKVKKNSSMERIASNVSKETGDEIRELELVGVKVDEDYKRYYPFGNLASKVLGFTGGDNQGILGLEAKYDEILAGHPGEILTLTDAYGVEIEGSEEKRNEPERGKSIYLSIDYNIQKYAQQLAEKVAEEKQAKQVAIIAMNPQNGEILAMVNSPEYDLNNPFQLNFTPDETQNAFPKLTLLNGMWRNFCINDTYEPGSTFKMITATAALETESVSLSSTFTCPGYKIVEDRRIRCHKTTGHGTQTFTETVMNSCNPAFITWGLATGKEKFYQYLSKLGILEKTGIDLPGEAGTIIHKIENVGDVELATMSFGQSFQITPLQLLRAASAIVNGGTLVTPHFAVKMIDGNGENVTEFEYETKENAIEKSTSDTMKDILRQVVEDGGGNKAYIEGFSIGGKTATSQKLPRGSGKYIASFVGFSPVDNPKIIAMCLIDEPQGVYYGGTIAAPVIRELFENVLPNLEINDD